MNPIKTALAFFTPGLMNMLHLPLLNTEATKFLSKLFLNTMNKRKDERTKRNDFLNLLMEITEKNHIQNKEKNVSSEPNDFHGGDDKHKINKRLATKKFIFS